MDILQGHSALLGGEKLKAGFPLIFWGEVYIRLIIRIKRKSFIEETFLKSGALLGHTIENTPENLETAVGKSRSCFIGGEAPVK